MNEWTSILLCMAGAIVSFLLCLWTPRLGLLLSPLFSVAVYLCCAALGPGAAPIGLGLAVCSELASLSALLVANYPIGKPSWPKTVASVILLAAASPVVIAAATGLGGPLGLVAAAALFAGVVRYVLIARNARTVHLFSTLAAAMRQALPLTTAIEIEAAWVKGSLRVLLRRVNNCLTQGMSLFLISASLVQHTMGVPIP